MKDSGKKSATYYFPVWFIRQIKMIAAEKGRHPYQIIMDAVKAKYGEPDE